MLTESSRQQDFPSLAGKVYLNTAAEGIPPRQVIDALSQYAGDKTLGMDGRALHEARWRSVRERTAIAYGLSPEEIGICSCSSEAYNLAALALQLREGDEVVINDLDFPAGATPWLQPSCPATVKIWRSREGALRVDDLIPLLSPKTRLVTVSLVSFFNGYKIPLPAITEAIRKHSSSLIALDVTQALGRIPLDLTDVDLIVSSTHKWILASHGGGLVGVPARVNEKWTVPAGGWFNLENAFEADRFEQTKTKPGAASFSVGMPNYPAIYAIDAGLKYNQAVGVEAIDEHCRPMIQFLLDELQQMPVEMLTPTEPESLAGIVAWRHPKAEFLYNTLHEQNIHVMYHSGRLRVAVHGYNTEQDIRRLVQSLHDALKQI
ncbi:MAG: aminotransferase class V-fold PLP-dependent enzyme [Planctomycetes bacterium]|nr:aminotransferase class V-fold PLP-dependent enzyme [Planctomycetota bacterium]